MIIYLFIYVCIIHISVEIMSDFVLNSIEIYWEIIMTAVVGYQPIVGFHFYFLEVFQFINEFID